MIQIRKKKQIFHQTIRKEFLEKYFREIRNKIHSDSVENEQYNDNQSKILKIIDLSILKNGLIEQLRNNSLIPYLTERIQNTLTSKDLLNCKYLLIILTNILRDQIHCHQRQIIIKLSFKVFRSVKPAVLCLQCKEDYQKIQKFVELISPEVLMYYFAEIIKSYQYLDQRDQQEIELNIYPTFPIVIFYVVTAKINLNFQSSFISDCQRCFHFFFDSHEESYEVGNRSKAERNIDIFIQMLRIHHQILSRGEQYLPIFQIIKVKLFWFYDQLSAYYDAIKSFFENRQLIDLILNGHFGKTQQQPSTSCLQIDRSCYSILRTYLDKKSFSKEIQQFFLSVNQRRKIQNLQVLLRTIESNNEASYEALQLLEGIIINFSQYSKYGNIVNRFWKEIISLCISELQNMEISVQYIESNRQQIHKLLSIIYFFIQIGNKKLVTESNYYLLYFQNQGGFLRIQKIISKMQEYDLRNEQHMNEIIDLLDYIKDCQDIEIYI